MEGNFKKKYIKNLTKKIENNEISLTEASNVVHEYLTKKKFD